MRRSVLRRRPRRGHWGGARMACAILGRLHGLLRICSLVCTKDRAVNNFPIFAVWLLLFRGAARYQMINGEVRMDAYTPDVERLMQRLYGSLGEKGRRRYAVIEAAKLGHGGIEYVARVVGCDPKTIRHGQAELEGNDDLNSERDRKKGGGANRSSTFIPPWRKTS